MLCITGRSTAQHSLGNIRVVQNIEETANREQQLVHGLDSKWRNHHWPSAIADMSPTPTAALSNTKQRLAALQQH